MRKLIGKGTFTKAYQISETEVEIVSICPAKECYALFSQGNTFAPVIEKIDYREDGFSVYNMPLYPKVTAPKKQLNAKAYAIYSELRKISCQYNMSYNSFVEAVEALNLSEDDKEQIIDIASDVANAIDCDDMGFEISPRNITTDDNGNLIMLDCFFSRKLLRSTRK
ncbi:MAG: hypothetical protein [Myoviridae sp. ctThM1]|nr:MAG: hypothetical protein [Myoviridae sp. ctThM1]